MLKAPTKQKFFLWVTLKESLSLSKKQSYFSCFRKVTVLQSSCRGFSDNILLPLINQKALKTLSLSLVFSVPPGFLSQVGDCVILNSSTGLKISFHLGSSCFSLCLCRLNNSAFAIVCKRFISVINRNMPYIQTPLETSMAGYIFSNISQTAKY